MTTQQQKPSPFRALLGSRKFVAGVVYAVISIACVIGARFGLDWNADAASATAIPWVVLGLSNIFGIAMEDAAQKSVGAGTTTTTVATGDVTKTTVEPDASRKP